MYESRNRRLIVSADDNPLDRRMLLEAFRDVDSSLEIHFVEDGDELLQYLSTLGKCENAYPPSLVLLDLAMPRVDGKQALSAIKTNPLLRPIPVIVLTGSQDQQDIHWVYDHPGTTFIIKPSNFEELVKIITAVCEFWFDICLLPGLPD